MQEEKNSLFKKKGFYLSACVMLIGVMAAGAVFCRGINTKKSNGNMMANISTEIPANTANPAGKSALSAKEKQVAQANAKVAKNIKEKKKIAAKKIENARKKAEKKIKEKKILQKKRTEKKTEKKKAASVLSQSPKIQHSFNEESGLLWPVKGQVIMKYSMNNTVYFKTLAEYRCNPGIVISAKKGTNVKAVADGRVTKIEKSDEYGTMITTDIGDRYKVSYGQLDHVTVKKGDEIKEGNVIGSVAKATKYYSKEGNNLFLEIKEGKETVDPLLLLR